MSIVAYEASDEVSALASRFDAGALSRQERWEFELFIGEAACSGCHEVTDGARPVDGSYQAADCWPGPENSENVAGEGVEEADIGNLGLRPEHEAACVAFLRTLTDIVGVAPPGPFVESTSDTRTTEQRRRSVRRTTRTSSLVDGTVQGGRTDETRSRREDASFTSAD